jgi:hypothetical protein
LEAETNSAARRGTVQLAITAMAALGGMAFSLAVALVVEELIFGKVLRLLFAPQSVAIKSGQQH